MQPTHRSVGLIIAILGAICVVLSGAMLFFVPAELPFIRPMVLLVVGLSLVVTAMGVARHVASRRGSDGAAFRSKQRWASLIAGVLSAVVLLALSGEVGEFARGLGDSAAIAAQVAVIVAAVAIAAIGIWGFVRTPTETRQDSFRSTEN